jgi:hypothetical protein
MDLQIKLDSFFYDDAAAKFFRSSRIPVSIFDIKRVPILRE